jgi:hypothetical protein
MTWRSFMPRGGGGVGRVFGYSRKIMDEASGRALGDQFEALRKQTLCGQDYPEFLVTRAKRQASSPKWLCRSEVVKRELNFLDL